MKLRRLFADARGARVLPPDLEGGVESPRHRGRLGDLVVVVGKAEHDQPLLRDLEPLEHPERVHPRDPDQIGLVHERERLHRLRPLGRAALDPLGRHRDRVGPARA